MLLPVPGFPEPEPVHVVLTVAPAHRDVSVRFAAEIQVPKLCKIRPDDLIRVAEDDLLQTQREHDVQKQDFVGPDDPLLVGLLVEPRRPLERDELVLEAVLGGHDGDELAMLVADRVADEPELDLPAGPLDGREDHDLLQSLVHVAACDGEDVDHLIASITWRTSPERRQLG